MKKRIGTLKGKPIVEGGGSNIIKKNEISIDDIGNSSSDSNDDDISYFGSGIDEPSLNEIFRGYFPLSKIVDYRKNPVLVNIPYFSFPDYNYLIEFGGNINAKQVYYNRNWISIKEVIEKEGLSIEILKPISKEDFYRIDYTQEEAAKIEQDYYNHYLQNAPSKP